MNRKIESYLDVLFSDIPRSRKSIELREELSANMNDRMDDYLKEGKSENQSYSLVIANMGDVDELLQEVSLTADTKKEVTHYRERNAMLRTVAIMLYILAPAVLIAMTSHYSGEYSVVAMFILIAIATGLLVYSGASTPKEYAHICVDDDNDEDERSQFASTGTWRTYRAITSMAWSIASVLYLIVSFMTFYWHITWIIFPITAAILSIFRTILQIKETNHV